MQVKYDGPLTGGSWNLGAVLRKTRRDGTMVRAYLDPNREPERYVWNTERKHGDPHFLRVKRRWRPRKAPRLIMYQRGS